jgi:hypothetical protein
MTALAGAMTEAIVAEEGPDGLLRKVSDPFWFQAFGSVLGFDWHSSGLTTTTCGALKEGLKSVSPDIGLIVAGGKGKTSRRTPFEIEEACESYGLDAAPLVRASKLSAKVDSAAVQDGFQVYQHSFLLTSTGSWAVVQQGMNADTKMARRYHWYTTSKFDSDPHEGVAGQPQDDVLNLVAGEGESNRKVSTELAREHPSKVASELEKMRTLTMPRHHWIKVADLDPKRMERILLNAYEAQPEDYTSLLAVKGVGAKGLRALSLVAELTYGEAATIKDPVSFSYAHGGKDGTPFPVDRTTYDSTIESLRSVVTASKAGRTETRDALKRLAKLETSPTREGDDPSPRLFIQ